MKENKSKKQILEQLRKMPLIQIACEKSGVARASFYRWKQKDKDFAKEVESAITEGEAMVTDMSEAQLITLIRDKNFQAIQLWLRSHSPKYTNKLELTGNINQSKEQELTSEQKKTVARALKLASLDKKHEKKQIQSIVK